MKERGAVWLLGVGQTLTYAGVYYAFPALLPELEAATGWTKAQLAVGPTLAFLVMAPSMSSAQMGWLIAASTLVGWWACTVTAKNMGVQDPGSIVWDEVVAFWLILWLIMPAGFAGQLVAFLLFRFFDAAKPGPVGWADQVFKGSGARGGWGILFDDFVAAFCTLLVIALWRFW